VCGFISLFNVSDGYWNVSLNDPNNFGGKEVSGTSLFIYGFAWGINNNILDKKIYLPANHKSMECDE
jgi:rhamnogalacturonyl hydrolase YesR